MIARYFPLKDPAGLWSVWDNDTNQPASFDGETLIGLGHVNATAMADVLNRMHAPPKPAAGVKKTG